MTSAIVVGGPQSNGIDAKVAELLGVECVRVEYKRFPDGEGYVRLPVSVAGKRVIIVQSMFPEQDMRFVELLLMIDAVREHGASEVIAVVPYIAYARQDRVFREGEPISIRAVLRAIEAAGADRIIVVNIHKEHCLQHLTKAKGVNLDATPLLAEYFKGKLENPLVLGPDAGALKQAKVAAEVLGAEYDHLEKFRDRVTGEITIKPKRLPVEGRDVLIVDDIISTGGTLAKAIKAVKEQGARSVYVGVIHGLFVGKAYEVLAEAAPNEVVTTDTVLNKFSKISVAPLIANALKELTKV